MRAIQPLALMLTLLCGIVVLPTKADDAANIKATLASLEAALKSMNYNKLASLCTPDFIDVHGNTAVTLDHWKQTFALMKKAGGVIKSMKITGGAPTIQGNTATVPVRRLTRILLKNPQTNKIDTLGEICTYRMTMAKLAGKWTLQKMETLDLKVKVNGKSKPDDS